MSDEMTGEEATDDGDERTPAQRMHYREMEIIDAWALRFDGYAFEAATKSTLFEGTNGYVDEGRLPDDPLHRLAILFGLQRWLGKFGGEYDPPHGRTWRRFRELFLMTSDVRVPTRYRFGHRYDDWKRDRLPRKAEDVAFVAKIHAETKYDDNAVPTL